MKNVLLISLPTAFLLVFFVVLKCTPSIPNLQGIKTTPAEITVLSGTKFLCSGIPCQLLGVIESDDPATRAKATAFTKTWFKNTGNCIGIYNSGNAPRVPDGTFLVWIRAYDSELSCLNVELVRRRLAKVEYAAYKDYTFIVPVKTPEGEEIEDWQEQLDVAK